MAICILLLLIYSSTAIAASSVAFHIDRNLVITGSKHQSEVIHFDSPMDSALLSWNLFMPADGYVKFQLRAKRAKGGWTSWFTMGVMNEQKGWTSVSGQNNNQGRVEVDTLILKRPAENWQYRVITKGSQKAGWPNVVNVALAAKNSQAFSKSDSGKRVRSLVVPAISQFEEASREGKPELGGRICSPTSSVMALRYNGIKIPSLIDYSMGVFDKDGDMFGNWAFNTAGLYNGLVRKRPGNTVATYLRWYSSFDDLLTNVAGGQPVIVSIKYGKGELDGAPNPTPGHLLLIRGADSKYVYVNDPAMPTDSKVSTRYKRDQFVKAWKGVAYVIE
ncbi:MAG: hypothetical protein HN337_02840 [Deltaproteobacteria bacterium]|nr:hypothetical protein [Deltaproteobacteria bacterium]